MKTILKITAGILLAGTVMIVGCAALIGSAATSVQKDLQTESDANSITLAQYRSIRPGDTRSAIVSKYGEPDSADETESSSYDGDGTNRHGCIYYNRTGKIASTFQLCFDENVLSSKSS